MMYSAVAFACKMGIVKHIKLITSCVLLKVNKTFQDLQIFQELNEAWMEVGPRIKNYMESSVETQLLQVSFTSCCRFTKRDEYVMIHFEPKIGFPYPLCVTEFVKAARGGSTGQLASGEHILDSLTDCTFPVHTFTRCPK